MLLFYVFASIAIPLRFIAIIYDFSPNVILYSNIGPLQQVAKLCVGWVQDWITFELSLRLRATQYCQGKTLPISLNNRLKCGHCTLTIMTIATFCAFTIAVILTELKDGNDGIAFGNDYDLVNEILGWIFFA